MRYYWLRLKFTCLLQIKVFTSSQTEEFYKYIPREQLPKEFGGDAGSLEDLTRKNQSIHTQKNKTIRWAFD